MTETDGSALASSSMTRHAAVNDEPLPPYSSSISMPMKPASKICLMSSGSICDAASIAATRGSTASEAKRAAASRIIASSSVTIVTLPV